MLEGALQALEALTVQREVSGGRGKQVSEQESRSLLLSRWWLCTTKPTSRSAIMYSRVCPLVRPIHHAKDRFKKHGRFKRRIASSMQSFSYARSRRCPPDVVVPVRSARTERASGEGQ